MRTNSAFILRNIMGKSILMPVLKNKVGGDPILLNDTSAYIWNVISEGKKRKNIIEEIANQFHLNLDSPEISAVESFINNMIDVGLIFDDEVNN